MDLERVREALSCGDTRRRRLVEVPTGHQLRSSREALETFLLIAEEVSEMALGRRLAGALPDLAAVERRRAAERARLPRPPADLRGFWADYLLGRGRELGMELLSATAAYRNFMEAQIRLLELGPGARVADLGSGNGDFPLLLARRPGLPPGLRVDALDYVPAALARGRERLRAAAPAGGLRVERLVADLDAPALALAEGRYDAALASLVVGYLADPERFLRELARILRPGGRVVLSTLRRDADISKLFLDGLAELAGPETRAALGRAAERRFDALARDFLNDAARLLDLEEQGRFRFFEREELRALVAGAGFEDPVAELAFGDPAQAVVVAARRP
jgi:ubiquinone/menaquinone biosynthesis C-methylase UbiE